MIMSNLCDYSNAYILAWGTITITGEGADDEAKPLDERNKGVIFKICAPFTECISTVNNIQIDNAKDIDVVMPMYNFIEFNCQISLDSTWSENYIISSATGKTKFAITDRKLYVPVLTLSTENNIKLLKPLQSAFKIDILIT